ncbi:cytochrome c peroxidase [Marinagarivorans cellulosilyticus]|uniref:Cytochrome c peroxidase n=1 Tax=Marinagarivorans cellulosilyticus TaxID=2721545 RepID=A0AAN1WES8_9GAMM|nr:cytochrome c peroxidase [Marinagarivorans cellulosilyticus]BCD96261.1 cytochrome c peroxidase [Marinagarivorans cellulosilyticus]
MMKQKARWLSALLMVCGVSVTDTVWAADEVTSKLPKATIGNILFHDARLSNPAGQSCATCHKPDQAFSDPGKAVSEGAIKGVFGSRNTPSLLYASFATTFERPKYENEWMGGFFWDGRVNTLQEQALGPLMNPIEMNNSVAGLAKKLRATGYYTNLKQVYGEALDKDDQALVDAAADALAAFQQSEQFHPFTSKFDYVEFGFAEFTEQEANGKRIFNGKAMCIDCHTGRFGPFQLFTRYKHHNILVPRNKALAFYGQPTTVNPLGHAFVDGGTQANPHLSAEDKLLARGLFRTPSLRNTAITPPYMHNGVFNTLEEVVDFYNDIDKFEPEVADNSSGMLTRKLNLTEQEKADLIAFLKTMTDGYEASPETFKALQAKQKQMKEQLEAQQAKYLKAEQERLKAEEERLKASGG